MEKTPKGTGVGVDDPYAHVDVCDHLTSEGTCRYAFEHPQHDPAFARERRRDDLACPVVADVGPDWNWSDCPHFRSTTEGRECARCGLEERRMAHDDDRPLVEEHHLSYADDAARRAADATELETPDDDGGADTDDGNGDDSENSDDGGPSHEVTVALCRWCHSKVHDSWARITDDANPSAEALAVAEDRRSRELDEAGFRSASERYDDLTADDDEGGETDGDEGDDGSR